MKTLIFMVTSIISLSTYALDVTCDIQINDRIVASGKQTIIHDKGEPEGSGHLLLANEGNIKIYVTTYPIEIIANAVQRYDDGTEIVMVTKRSNILGTLLFHQKSATLNTNLDDQKIHAKCTEVNID